LSDLFSDSASVTPRAGKLIADAPGGALTEQDREMLARHKGDLLALLAAPGTVANLPPDWHLLWDERAAILEVEGRLPRERAEALALKQIIRAMERVGVPSEGSPCGFLLPGGIGFCTLNESKGTRTDRARARWQPQGSAPMTPEE
jgi:hypothetical protein